MAVTDVQKTTEHETHAHKTAAKTPKLRVLLYGPLPPPFGGATVSFFHLIEQLKTKAELSLVVIDRRPFRRAPHRALYATLRQVLEVARLSRTVDVISFHCSTPALSFMGVAIAAIGRFSRTPVIFRTFGGTHYSGVLGPLLARFARWALRHSDIYLAQTKSLVDRMRAEGLTQTRWFPTSRPLTAVPAAGDEEDDDGEPRPCRRFVFVGHVRTEKGIRELIEAGERFRGTDVEITVVGPLGFDLTQSVFETCSVVRYGGTAAPEDVPKILAEQDCLVLPSYKEGYAGALVEAFAAGLPAVCSDLPSLREIVDESCGLMVPPRGSEALHAAMASLVEDPDLFRKLREGAAVKRLQFDAAAWADTFTDYCREVATSPKL